MSLFKLYPQRTIHHMARAIKQLHDLADRKEHADFWAAIIQTAQPEFDVDYWYSLCDVEAREVPWWRQSCDMGIVSR